MTRILAIAALVIIRELLGRAMFNEIADEGVRLSLNFGFLLLAAHLTGQAFARILAVPSAALDRSRHVLLVFTDDPEQDG